MVAQQLDREARASYVLIITATDQGMGNNQATVSVQSFILMHGILINSR